MKQTYERINFYGSFIITAILLFCGNKYLLQQIVTFLNLRSVMFFLIFDQFDSENRKIEIEQWKLKSFNVISIIRMLYKMIRTCM